jgi:predicted nucleic acid-binding protein
MILVDTNVLLDVLENDARWAAWSQEKLDAASTTETLAINPIIYSELSIAFGRIEELEAVIAEAALTVESIPREALFLAGKAFLAYRRGSGTKLTRDAGRFRSYFPTVPLITPQSSGK